MHTENEQKAGGEMFHLAKNPEGQFCVNGPSVRLAPNWGQYLHVPRSAVQLGFFFMCKVLFIRIISECGLKGCKMFGA